MNTLEQKLKIAKRNFRTNMCFGAFAGLFLFALLLPLIYFTHSMTIRVTPQAASDDASVSVSAGVGVVFLDTLYMLGNRATLRAVARGFVSRTLAIDLEKGIPPDTRPLVIEMQESAARVSVTTEPSLINTRWHVNGAYTDTAKQFDREFQPGVVRIEINHEFYQPQILSILAQRGVAIARHVKLAPQNGAIDIRSEPAGARVTINGEEKGQTPIRTTAVGGLYRVRVALDGYQAVEEEIAITNIVPNIWRDYRLALKQSTVRIQASPSGGVLRVNGVAIDVATDVALSLKLAVGRTHVIRYEKPGYLSQAREVWLDVNEQSADSYSLVFALDKEIGEVFIRSTPPADIYLNDLAMGSTPQIFHLQALPQKIKLARSGYRSLEWSVTPSSIAPQWFDKKLNTEFAARLAEAMPMVTVAGVALKFFAPRTQVAAQSNGRFTMGAPKNDNARRANEFQREVVLTKPFYVSTHEITEAQFAQYKPLPLSGKKHPVRNVSWSDAAAFCNWLSARDGKQLAYHFIAGQVRGFDATADGYRLLSEAEWEWLARVAGRRGAARFVWGDDTTIPANSGNFADLSAQGSVPKYIPRYHDGFANVAPVASFVVSAAGLYDMAGNVSEWVHDVYDLRPPEPGQIETNPFGGARDTQISDAHVGKAHVIKGASYRSASITNLRASFREGLLHGRDDVGFRVARNLYGKE